MINYQTIREQVYAYIRNQILQQKIKPGARILEQEIADELGVSRGPVRESLRQLEQDGLLEYRRNRGCTVRLFEIKDAAEIFMLRSAMECISIYQCGGALPDSTLDKMEQELKNMASLVDERRLDAFLESDERFHSLIMQASGSERLNKLWNSLTSLNIAIFLTEGKRDKFILENQYSRHKALLDDLRKKDMDIAGKALGDHYVKTNAIFL